MANNETLNKAQQQVVAHKSGEMLIVAGAGTGKTKTIVERISKLVNSGTDKSEVLALTFTEKAANEMLDRVSDALGSGYGAEYAVHTFNAFGQMLIEEFASEVGLSSKQKLVGEEGRVVFMREHFDSFELDYFAPHSKPDSQLITLAEHFSEAKQQLVMPEKYKKFADNLPTSDEADKLDKKKHTELVSAYKTYLELMRSNNIIDYDDQIFLAIDILEQRPNIVRKLRERYKHIMIDEFQDTNPMQSRLVDLLYGEPGQTKRSLVVVGDDDQAIYEWRGATLANILDFTKRYPAAEKVTLATNYRSTQEILDSAWELIQHNNPERLEVIENLDKKLVAHGGSGMTPQVYEFETLQQELSFVAENIKNSVAALQAADKTASIAVLTRSRRLTGQMHDMLSASNVEHVVAGLSEDLYTQPIVTTMLDALACVWQPNNAGPALYHTLTSPLFSCDLAIVSEAAYESRSKKIPLATIIAGLDDEKIQEAYKMIMSWHTKVAEKSVRQLSYTIISESGLKDTLYKQAMENAQAERDVLTLGQWFQSLQDFESIASTPSTFAYLENIDLLRAEGETLDDTNEIVPGMPVVMTMHKSKGLEWDTVYVIGANERSFPYLGGGSSLSLPDDLRISAKADSRIYEERRLMYVAATRASRELVITHSKKTSGGKIERKPSRFIAEMKLASEQKESANVHSELESTQKTNDKAVRLPKKLVDGEYIALSASQAEDYLHCPRNFYYKHVLHVPDISGPETEVGSLIHDIIQEINEAKKDKKEVPAHGSLKKRLSDEWPERGYASRKQRDQKLAQALQAFDTLYETLIDAPEPIAVEESFRLKIPNSVCVLHGRFDAVVPYEKGTEIHDYKTNTGVVDDEKALKKVKQSHQLTMYAVAWRLLSGEKPDTVALDFVLTGRVGRMKKQDRSLDTMERKLAEIAEKIKAYEFPEGQRHDYCIHP